MAVNKGYVCAGVIAVLVVCLAFIVLMSMSFATLNYHEYGFVRDRTAGNIETVTVYGPGGWYPIGPNKDFKTFKSDAHFVLLKNILVFTNDKLEITMTVNIVYFLRKHDLPLLLRQFDVYYEKPIEHNAVTAVKAATTVFSKDEFILDRKLVEDALFKAVRDRLEGRCCRKECSRRNNCLRDDCTKYDECKSKDKGLFADVRYFQLTEVSIPKDVHIKYLNALVLQEETVAEEYRQEVHVVQKRTDAQVKQIKNTAAEILKNATAEASLILSKARASSAAMLEKARGKGLKHLYTSLSLNSAEYRSTFDYLMVLKNHPGAHISVDYNQLIAGGFK